MQQPLISHLVFQSHDHILDSMNRDELTALYDNVAGQSCQTVQEWALAHMSDADYRRKQAVLDDSLLILDAWLDYRAINSFTDSSPVTFPGFLFADWFSDGPVVAGEPHVPVPPQTPSLPTACCCNRCDNHITFGVTCKVCIAGGMPPIPAGSACRAQNMGRMMEDDFDPTRSSRLH